MASVDERVVAMSFENTTFEAKVAQTQATLAKLNQTIATIGAVNGLADLEKASQKVTLQAPMSALDKLKAKLGFGREAAEGLGEIDKAGNKVSLLNPLTAIDKVKAHLSTVGVGAADGFADIEKASGKVTLAPLSSAVDSIQAKFSGMTVAFTAAMATIVTNATQAAGRLVKGFSFEPIVGGLEEYATNLNSIQTILANTQASGADLNDVNKALQQLNRYSDQTIYNFSQMAKNIGTFTAAGVDLDTATQSIKGIANLAALSGSNAEQASTAMYQLSQAISAGRVSLQDWNSVVNAGMGGTVFQRALAQTAENMGTLSDGAVELKGKMKNVTIEGQSFRESITAKPGEKSWLTSKVLTNTLKQFTGDLSEAELAAQGFNDEQIKAILKTAETAKKAATEVKTLKGVFDVAKESIGSGWAATFQIIFGNFTEAKKTFTDLSTAIQNVIGNAASARNAVLEDWKKLGGRQELIEGIKATFEALLSVLKPIHDAFRDIFPRKTGEDLYNLTVQFREFMEALKIGPETAENLRRTFRGFFAALHIGTTIVKGIIGVIFDLLGVVGQGSGGFLAFTGSIGDFLVALDHAISKGEGLEGVFEALGASLEVPLQLLKAIASSIKSLFSDADPEAGVDLSQSLNDIATELGPLGTALKNIIKVWEKFFEIMQQIGEFLMPILEDVRDVFSQIGDAIIEGLNKVDFDKVMLAIQTGLLGGLAVGLKKLLGGIGLDLTGGTLATFKDVMNTLQGTLTAIQRNVNAQTMLLIAASVVALAAAAIMFSKIDPKKLAQAMAAITVGIAQLSGAMILLNKVGGSLVGAASLPFIAAGMVILAGALVVLGAAVHIFARLNWEDMAKGLLGVAGGLAAILAATKFMGPGILLIGPGLIAVAIAMNLLAVSVQVFGKMDWEEMAKGLIGIAGALLAVGIGAKALGPSLLLVGPGLIAASIGLILLSGAVSSFGNMKLETIGKGILGIAAALIVIGTAISAIPLTIGVQAAGLIVLGVALTTLAAAVAAFGNLKIATIVKGLTAIAGALVIFAAGLTLMGGTLAGSAALLAAAAAFAILTPSLIILGNLEWSTIIKGLGAIALTLGVLAAVGAIAAPALTALGVALLLISGSVLAVSTGIYILAKAFTLLGEEGTKGVAVMITAITALIALLPSMVINFLKGLTEILAALVKLAPQIAENLVKIMGIFIDSLVEMQPKAAELIGVVLATIIQLIDAHGKPLIEAGFRLLVNFLSGIANNIGKVTEQVVGIIIGFLNAMVANAPRLTTSGARALAAWLKGIADNIGQVVAHAARVVVKFLEAIIERLPGVYATGVKLLVTFLKSVADGLPKVIRAGVNVLLAIIEGIARAVPRVIDKAVDVIVAFIRAIGRESPRIADAGAKAIIDFIHGMARAIRNNDKELLDAVGDLGHAIIEALINAIKAGAAGVVNTLKDVAGDAVGGVTDFLGISSPSKVFLEIGKQVMDGWAIGIASNGRNVVKSIESVGEDVVGSTTAMLAKVPDILGEITDLDPVITPVLDLSNVERGAQRLTDLTNVTPITAAASFGQAASISEERQTVEEETPVSSPTFIFEQNNTSPESLSEIEIYRRTSNQLAQAKGVLGLAT